MNAAAKGRLFSARQFAVFLTGFCCFINLYSPQAILPLLSIEMAVTAAGAAAVITASTFAVAMTAPFTGAAADVIGRKHVIVAAMFLVTIPTLMSALAPTLPEIVFWRFVQGLVMPPIFVVIIAYIGEEWPRAEAATATGIYTSGASLGGFSGRFVAGIFSDIIGWRGGMMVLAAITLAGAIAVMLLLPREKKFVRSAGFGTALKQMVRHFRNPQLVATYAVGFGVLFNFLATFTFISFRLAAAPYNLSATALGIIFVVYLLGAGLTPWTGVAIARFGRRHFMMVNFAVWAAGLALTLTDPLWMILLGLALCAACGLITQATSTGYVTITAQFGRSSAVGLYVTSFYLGGSVGGALGGIVWTYGGWPAVVAMCVAMLVIMACIVFFAWAKRVQAAPQTTAIEPP
jgi:predicted MFS family arabinose efflux permease